MNTHRLTTRHLFIFYARMLATRESVPVVREYHEKRYRVVAGLFGISLEKTGPLEMVRLLPWLADRRENLRAHDPYADLLLGTPPQPDLSIYLRHRYDLRRRAATIRRLYDQMGAELIDAAYPEAAEMVVSIDRRKQFGLADAPPNENEECLKYMDEHWDDEAIEKEVRDDVPPERTDRLLRTEEEHLRKMRAVAAAKDAVRQRAIERGLAQETSVDRAIYEMDVETFIEITGDFRYLSRVDFKRRPSRTE